MLTVASTGLAGALAAAPAQAATPGSAAADLAVGTWAAAPDLTTATLADQSVRNIVHTSVAGANPRVTLSNRWGTGPVTFSAAYLGVQSDGAALVPGSNRPLTFRGSSRVTVPAGAEVVSDPVRAHLPAGSTLAVSLDVEGDPGVVTGHNVANQTSWVAPTSGQAAREDGAGFTGTMTRWYWVASVVVDAAAPVASVVTFGDSITDGNGSTRSANRRWPDQLARRLSALPQAEQKGVVNEGISANRLLGDSSGGQKGLDRFDRDVLDQPDVETVVVLEGINDIRWDLATQPSDLTDAYTELVRRAHARGVCVVGATLTPFEGGSRYSEDREAVRTGVNDWIRTSGVFDSVVDFDRAARDPERPQRMLPAYDSGDHLHPGDAGYAAMAAAVPLSALDCAR